MPEYLFLMHNDAMVDGTAWEPYLRKLREGGFLQGGSAIGDGVGVRKDGAHADITTHLAGFVRIDAKSVDHAKSLLIGNPVFEAGGTVEIRSLPRTD